MERRWFAVAVSALNQTYEGLQIVCKPLAIFAPSEEEACGLAIDTLRELYPIEDGYTDYRAAAVAFPV